jgi:hypothetical protein
MGWEAGAGTLTIDITLEQLLKVLKGIEKDLDTMNIELGNIRHIMLREEKK